MDPEQTFLRVHTRLSGMLAQLVSPRLRGFLEHLCLVVAILLLTLLAVMHMNFVSQAGCAKELSGDQIAEADLLQIKMVEHGLWSKRTFSESLDDIYADTQSSASQRVNISILTGRSWLRWFLSCALRGIWRKTAAPGTHVVGDCSKVADADGSMDSDAEREAALLQLWDSWTLYSATWLAKVGDVARRFAKFWRNAGRELLFSDGSHAFNQKDHASVEGANDAFEPVYMFSVQRGYLLLPEDAKSRHNVHTMNISMSARNSCFGNRWQQLLINSLVGYDTILMNSLLEAVGEGYLYNYQTKELYDLNYPQEARGTPSSFQGYVISKCGVLLMSLFVFFTTTMSVSFTLRETQARMLKFTVQLQYHARHRLPTFRLIFVHVIESLVFVPIMIGILFFLFEFYEDQLLAFMVLTLVWLCELFTMISVRTPVSMQYFPRFFFLYFMIFHIYFFSYEYGFSYLAFSTTAAFMQHLVLYFWNHFEVPALQRFMRARTFFQQPGVQITSSAIITSTLHVSGVAPAGLEPTTQTTNLGTSVQHNGIEENTRNLSFLRHLRRSESSQVWTDSAVDRIWLGHLNSSNNSIVESNRHVGDGSQGDGSSAMMSHVVDSPSTQDTNIGQDSLDTSTERTLPPVAALNSFGSVLLWILGGPSVHLSAYLPPMFRDTSQENHPPLHEGNASQQSQESEGGLQRLRRRVRNMLENDRNL